MLKAHAHASLLFLAYRGALNEHVRRVSFLFPSIFCNFYAGVSACGRPTKDVEKASNTVSPTPTPASPSDSVLNRYADVSAN
ncbi:hypothetical protein RB195_001344 [Necator americanus]|uniref:Secreted protein n=1 Tax=Necator americanus TaxID=51031 RepID=A0ABR1DF41_NECAM